MSTSRWRGARASSLALAVLLAASLAPAATVLAAGGDTPTLGGNADCWKTGTPYWCRSNWQGVSTSITFRAVDHFSDVVPGWRTQANAAMSAWSSAAGPQVVSWTATANDNPVYLYDATTGEHGLVDITIGKTFNCTASVCSNAAAQSLNVTYTNIYFNRANLVDDTAQHIRNAFAHEMGHAMGLFHNSTDNTSLMWATQSNITGPNAHDIGASPGCNASGHGVR